MPGAQYALTIVHPPSPVLRVRYRDGVLIDPYGFPDWVLYARALVDLPAPEPDLGRDETRVLDVLAANLALVGDPLWSGAAATPAGWCWAHLGRTRRLALVPIELHGAWRHGGGVRTTAVSSAVTGLRVEPGIPVAFDGGDEVPADVAADLDRLLGRELPPAYRRFLAATNGAGPREPAVHPGYGFLLDQPLFGLARTDPHQDLAYAPDWLADRFTPDLLPIGYVQGGILAAGADGAIWYWDDDDPRAEARHTPADIRGLLHRCANDFDEFRAALTTPSHLWERARSWVDAGSAVPVHDDDAGHGLPPAMRAPGHRPADRRRDPVVAMFTR